jgi:hypothetical protein
MQPDTVEAGRRVQLPALPLVAGGHLHHLPQVGVYLGHEVGVAPGRGDQGRVIQAYGRDLLAVTHGSGIAKVAK